MKKVSLFIFFYSLILLPGLYGQDLNNLNPSQEETQASFAPDGVGWCNLQWPGSANITTAETATVYAQVWVDNITPGDWQGANISCWIGVNSENTNPSTWSSDSWHQASYNAAVTGNNDEYMANIGENLSPGVYYYASRFQYWSDPYDYGGYSGGFWDGINNVSGVLTVTTVLPLEIIDFSGIACEDKNMLYWDIQTNNDYNEVQLQRSDISENSWTTLASFKKEFFETINSFNDFSFKPNSLYRLSIIDKNGSQAYSKIISIQNNSLIDPFKITLYPNPNNGQFTLEMENNPSNTLNLLLFDHIGKCVYSTSLTGDKLKNSTEFDLRFLGSGIYVLKVNDERKTHVHKIIIQ